MISIYEPHKDLRFQEQILRTLAEMKRSLEELMPQVVP
jgi:hypothetical protein